MKKIIYLLVICISVFYAGCKDDDLLKQDNTEKNDIKADREDDILKNDITITVNGDFNGIVYFIKRE